MYLVEQADDNQDGMVITIIVYTLMWLFCILQLSLQEILNHSSLFVGSRGANLISYNLGHVIHWEL